MTAYMTSYDYLIAQDASDDESDYSLEADDDRSDYSFDEEDALEAALEDIDDEWDRIENEIEEDIDEGIGLVDEIYERIEMLDYLQRYADTVYGGYTSLFAMVD
jgi:hypothetical protein